MNGQPARFLVGVGRSPILVVDNVGPSIAEIVGLARRLGPFPKATNNYPGLRRVIDEADANSWDYVVRLLNEMSPFIAGAFDLEGFDLIEASFSLVTTPAALLSPVQRNPHFDSTDPKLIALMHYVCECDGTAFYRHRATRTELVTEQNLAPYVAAARADALRSAPDYVAGSNQAYEQIGTVQGVPRRFVGYQGSLLHSGIIPAEFRGSDDPGLGRLTCNLFVRGW